MTAWDRTSLLRYANAEDGPLYPCAWRFRWRHLGASLAKPASALLTRDIGRGFIIVTGGRSDAAAAILGRVVAAAQGFDRSGY